MYMSMYMYIHVAVNFLRIFFQRLNVTHLLMYQMQHKPDVVVGT